MLYEDGFAEFDSDVANIQVVGRFLLKQGNMAVTFLIFFVSSGGSVEAPVNSLTQ